MDKIVVLMGATATGKSSLAIKISEKIPSEIISVDSMQCYIGMDIGTAKPTKEELEKYPHHMIDIFPITQRVDVFSYVDMMREKVSQITNRKRLPIIVGGTGLYIKSFLYGLDQLPTDKKIREDLYSQHGEDVEKISAELSKFDPVAVQKFSTNPRRLLRALEVFIITGKSILEQKGVWNEQKSLYNSFLIHIKKDRVVLFSDIEKRVDFMLKNGWIEETKELTQKQFFNMPTSKQAIGYCLINRYLENEISYDEMRAKIISSTKKYARRQETWFNNQHKDASIFYTNTPLPLGNTLLNFESILFQKNQIFKIPLVYLPNDEQEIIEKVIQFSIS